jgi:hypothetical chaperone protein
MAERSGIGIDFGTTNSTAAVYDGERLRLVVLEAGLQPIMPSATYIDVELKTETGQAAIDRYIADNTGRTVELVPEVIGAASVMVGDPDPEGRRPVETLTKKVYGQPMNDSGLQGRLFRGTKRLLGDPNVRRLMVFEHPFRLVALITPILLRIRRAIEAGQLHDSRDGDFVPRPLPGLDPSVACVGHPVNFEGKAEHRNKLALTRLGEAYQYAGLVHHDLYPEPVAAAVSYLHDHPGASGSHLLTVDFGGGTLDFCVLRRRDGARFDVLATHGLALGGDHIDQRLFRTLLFPLLGKGEIWRRRGIDREIETRFPFEDYEDFLLNWPVTYMLNQNRYTTPVMDRIEQGGPAMHKFRRLRELIKQNYGYLVFQAIKDVKADLSERDEAVLDIPEIDVELAITRARFEETIADLLDQFRAGVTDAVAASGLALRDIDLVVRTGGSSLIPAVRAILEDCFPGRVVDQDPFTSVAAGLALAHFHGLSSPAADVIGPTAALQPSRKQ